MIPQTNAQKAREVRRVQKLRRDERLASLHDVSEVANALIQEIARHESLYDDFLIDMDAYISIEKLAAKYLDRP